MRTLVISDIHGCLDELRALLRQTGYTPGEDKLILLGDYVDRGLNSKETVEEAIRLVNNGAAAIRGNHDQRLADLVRNGGDEVVRKFFEHGGEQTFRSYAGVPSSDMSLSAFRQLMLTKFAHHLAFLEELPFYIEDDRHIYVHAGLHPDFSNWKEQPEYNFMYIKEPFLSRPAAVSKTVVFGHTRTADIHGSANIWFGGGKIGIDGGCAYGMQLNALEIAKDGSYTARHVARGC
ncbi:metallophosphoesterase family protein [Paenibacillus protaetiae]|uniref:Serine/threonine protein phosphatase n=1 Tax=Paenibacillus protaetiae TaxID=2509456 RepID=A0A4P6EYD6_9BACL|nr:metallophosphoesterase family protein [Paenibacillus protaetiae]QAY68094.1 serine/threonine protein phosphatase [Paenibacillus protaetiae]